MVSGGTAGARRSRLFQSKGDAALGEQQVHLAAEAVAEGSVEERSDERGGGGDGNRGGNAGQVQHDSRDGDDEPDEMTLAFNEMMRGH